MTYRMFPGARRDGRARFGRDESGVSAIEFGLVAPLIFFSLLSMVDVGFALNERMYVDQLLRSAGQPAMRDEGETRVEETLKRASCETGETYPVCGNISEVTVAADRYCVCPITGVKDSSCTATCTVQPQIFYEVAAMKSYDGIFLPQFNFAPSILVEVR